LLGAFHINTEEKKMELNTVELGALLVTTLHEEAVAAQELTELQLALVGGGSGGDPAFV
jgi:hypothetical protein